MRKALTAALLLSAFATSGCYHTRVVNENATAGETTEVSGRYVLYGIVPIGNNDIDVDDECPNGLASVESEHTFIDGLIGTVTLGIYTPITIRYTCAQ